VQRRAGLSYRADSRLEWRVLEVYLLLMRSFGIILLLGGVLGFFYCTDQGWEAGRYACAAGAGLGFLLALFPKGR